MSSLQGEKNETMGDKGKTKMETDVKPPEWRWWHK